jgi:hypothetical protein
MVPRHKVPRHGWRSKVPREKVYGCEGEVVGSEAEGSEAEAVGAPQHNRGSSGRTWFRGRGS